MNEKHLKKVRIADIAEELNLSPTTVSFVLNERTDKGISDETAALVIETAIKMGYKPKARTSNLGWTKAAFLTSDIANFNFHTSFFAGVYTHLHRMSLASKVELSLMELRYDGEKGFPLSDTRKIIDSGAEVFLASDSGILDHMRRQGRGTVLAQGGSSTDHICVRCDDRAAGALAAEHAFEMGHTRAGMIFPSKGSPRFNGFLEKFIELGGACPEEFQWIMPLDHARLEMKVGAKASSARSALPPLFYCFADNIMFPAIRGFAACGLSVPEDVSLIGTDNLYWGAYANPAFTTVDLNEKLFAEKLIEAIGHAAANAPPYDLAVPVRLLKRETVKRI